MFKIALICAAFAALQRHIYRPGTAQEGGQQGKAGAAPVPQQVKQTPVLGG